MSHWRIVPLTIIGSWAFIHYWWLEELYYYFLIFFYYSLYVVVGGCIFNITCSGCFQAWWNTFNNIRYVYFNLCNLHYGLFGLTMLYCSRTIIQMLINVNSLIVFIIINICAVPPWKRYPRQTGSQLFSILLGLCRLLVPIDHYQYFSH